MEYPNQSITPHNFPLYLETESLPSQPHKPQHIMKNRGARPCMAVLV